MKIGIFGGTFNPPHAGHVRAAAECVRALGLDRLLVIPDAVPPHKMLADNSPDEKTRLRLCHIAFDGVKHARVSDMEIKRGGKSYTVETLRRVRRKYPGAKLFLLMGTDMALCFEEWREFREIIALATLVFFKRRDGEDEVLQEAVEKLTGQYGANVRTVEFDGVEASSTDVRALLPKRRGRELLTEDIYREIIRRRLYGARPDFDWLREKAYAMLEPKRVSHVAGCEEEAVRLARLLHSKTGAGIAKYEFGCDDEVAGAIFWHTTGKEDMSLLEKVIYMADYIEPNRDFDGVEALRAAAYEDLDRALEMGFRMSIEDMESRDIVPHARTLGALAWIRKDNG